MKQGDVRRRAVVFDFDGTLVDSMSLVFSAISHALEPFRPLTQAEIFAKLGGPPERFMPALLENDAHVPAAMLRLETFDRENQHLIQPFADTVTFLEAMRTRHPDVQLAIWTGRDRASGTWLMRTLRLESYFATVVFGDDLATHKPEPDGLREILRRLDVAPREALFVGAVRGRRGCGYSRRRGGGGGFDFDRARPADRSGGAPAGVAGGGFARGGVRGGVGWVQR